MDASCATVDDDDDDVIMRILCTFVRHIHPIPTVLLTTNAFCNMFPHDAAHIRADATRIPMIEHHADMCAARWLSMRVEAWRHR